MMDSAIPSEVSSLSGEEVDGNSNEKALTPYQVWSLDSHDNPDDLNVESSQTECKFADSAPQGNRPRPQLPAARKVKLQKAATISSRTSHLVDSGVSTNSSAGPLARSFSNLSMRRRDRGESFDQTTSARLSPRELSSAVRQRQKEALRNLPSNCTDENTNEELSYFVTVLESDIKGSSSAEYTPTSMKSFFSEHTDNDNQSAVMSSPLSGASGHATFANLDGPGTATSSGASTPPTMTGARLLASRAMKAGKSLPRAINREEMNRMREQMERELLCEGLSICSTTSETTDTSLDNSVSSAGGDGVGVPDLKALNQRSSPGLPSPPQGPHARGGGEAKGMEKKRGGHQSHSRALSVGEGTRDLALRAFFNSSLRDRMEGAKDETK